MLYCSLLVLQLLHTIKDVFTCDFACSQATCFWQPINFNGLQVRLLKLCHIKAHGTMHFWLLQTHPHLREAWGCHYDLNAPTSICTQQLFVCMWCGENMLFCAVVGRDQFSFRIFFPFYIHQMILPVTFPLLGKHRSLTGLYLCGSSIGTVGNWDYKKHPPYVNL